jgi:hypothetical protein
VLEVSVDVGVGVGGTLVVGVVVDSVGSVAAGVSPHAARAATRTAIPTSLRTLRL